MIRKPVGNPESNAPRITISSPYAGQFFASGVTIPVSGSVTDESALASLTVSSSLIANGSLLIAPNPDGTFSTVMSLPDGSQTLTVRARDVWNNEGTASVNVVVDSTPPVIRFWDPIEGATVNTSPYPVTGTVVDEYLAHFTINGVTVYPSGGIFLAPVALVQGLNEVTATAEDLVGHLTTATLQFNMSGTPPAVFILAPKQGDTIETTPVEVIVQAAAAPGRSLPRAAVEVNGIEARYADGTTWSAWLNLSACPAPGAGAPQCSSVPEGGRCCLLQAVVTDDLDVSGSTSVAVVYRDVNQLPLTVTSILPQTCAQNVEADGIIQITFSKPIQPQTLAEALQITAMGESVTGGISYLPGNRLVTFAPYGYLPYSAKVEITVTDDLDPESGPGMVADYTSYFTVRSAPTIVRGVVSDENMGPLADVKISLADPGNPFAAKHPGLPEDQSAAIWSAPADKGGNFSIGDLAASLPQLPTGQSVLRIEGDHISSGDSHYPNLLIPVHLKPGEINSAKTVFLTPIDKMSGVGKLLGSGLYFAVWME